MVFGLAQVAYVIEQSLGRRSNVDDEIGFGMKSRFATLVLPFVLVHDGNVHGDDGHVGAEQLAERRRPRVFTRMGSRRHDFAHRVSPMIRLCSNPYLAILPENRPSREDGSVAFFPRRQISWLPARRLNIMKPVSKTNELGESTMSIQRMLDILCPQLDDLKAKGLYKRERQIQSPQRPAIKVGGQEVLNFCANNYLGLASHPAILEAAHEGLRRYGYGMASVRFICGTQDLHKELEKTIAGFLNKGDSILYSSCFDANTGLFETLLNEEDTLLSDELNHASIIDGIRLCKAKRFRYKHSDLGELERGLKEAAGSRQRLIATDGVFSMDGDMAKLPEICDLAEKYDAAVMVDDSHATGVLGAGGARERGGVGRFGSRGHHHQHVGQSAGRRGRRLHLFAG